MAQAIGHFTITWNLIEVTASEILARYMKHEHEISDAFFSALTNQSRVSIIEKIINERENRQEVIDAYGHFFRCFSVVAENRNIISHSSVFWNDDQFPTRLRKLSKTRLGDWVFFKYDLESLIKCQSDAENVLVYGKTVLVAEVINDLRTNPRKGLEHLLSTDPKTLALPGKPPLPSRLQVHPLEGDQDDQGPPQSSPE